MKLQTGAGTPFPFRGPPVQAADTLDKLTAGGWAAQAVMFDLILSHPQVSTRKQAVQRLQALGIDPEPFLIIEDVEEEEESYWGLVLSGYGERLSERRGIT